MDFTITKVTDPDERDWRTVEYRTSDGERHERAYTSLEPLTPEQAVREELDFQVKHPPNPTLPPGPFGLFVKMDGTDRSMDELKRVYTEFAKSRGYEVDADMRPYKPAPA